MLSRNLTHDRSWDLVARLDSEGVSPHPIAANRGLGDFLASLPGRSVRPLARARSTRIAGLAEAARRVEWSLPETVEQLAFHFLDGGRTGSPDFTGRRHLVVSPFLNDRGVDLVTDGGAATVLSRPEQLEQLTHETLARVEALVMDTMAGIDENGTTNDDQDGPAGTTLLGQLHAKMYVVEPHGRAQKARVLLGSANATEAAWQHNVEFLVELAGPRRHLGVDAFLGTDAPLRELTECYEATGGVAEDPQEDERRRLDSALRRVGEIPHRVRAARTSDTQDPHRYDVAVTSHAAYLLPPEWQVTIELMTRPGEAKHPDSATKVGEVFDSLPTADITPFVVVRVRTESGLEAGTVLVADLVGAPADRLDEVLARQIDTPEKFLRFLYLLLSLGDPHLLALLQRDADGEGENNLASVLADGGPGVLELVLRALTDRPEALGDLDRLIRRLRSTERGREALPTGFDNLWEAVEQAQRRISGAVR